MRTSDHSKSTNQRPGNGVMSLLSKSLNPTNSSHVTMCPKGCHSQCDGFQQEQAIRNINCKLLIFLEQNSIICFI